jgi:DNA-binding transcriptional MerR regulator
LRKIASVVRLTEAAMSDLPIPRKQFAAELGVPVRTLDRWARAGCYGVRLAQSLRGGRVFYCRADYEAWQRQVAKARAPKERLPVPSPREMDRRNREWRERLRARGMNV